MLNLSVPVGIHSLLLCCIQFSFNWLLVAGTDAVTSVMTSKIVSEHALFAEDSNGNITHPEYLELAYNGSRYTIAEWSQIQIASAAGFLCGIWQVNNC